jgi:cation diffusion facilitator family transporter
VEIQDLYSRSRMAAAWGVIIAVVLGVAKLAGGLLGHSVALVSDAVHSLGDALAAAAVWGALVWAQRPADREHPYGHMRVEAVVGSNMALLLVLSALWVAWEALTTLGTPAPPPEAYTLAIAGASMVLNECLYRYSHQVARGTGSRAVLGAAWDQRLDALGSLVVLVGLALARWCDWHAADHYAALVVAGVILWAGTALFWGSLQELMDRQADPEMLETIRKEAEAVPGVVGIEKLLVRKAGLEYLVDIHVEVDPESSVKRGHAIGHDVKNRLVARLLTVRDVLVHIEPAPVPERPGSANRG